jgi:hypothetical protein
MKTVRIAKNGTVTMVHDDEVGFDEFDRRITRLTDVRFDDGEQKWKVIPLHDTLKEYGLGEFSFQDRKSALAFEADFINELIQKGEIR